MQVLNAFVLVAKTSIVDSILNWAKYKADQQIKKTDGAKRTRYVFTLKPLAL